MGFGPGSRRPYGGPGGEEDALEGLGELAQLTVTNEADASYDVSFKSWTFTINYWHDLCNYSLKGTEIIYLAMTYLWLTYISIVLHECFTSSDIINQRKL